MKLLQQPEAVAEILEGLARFSPQGERVWGKMTAHEMLFHLGDSFEIAIGEQTCPAERLPRPPGVVKVLALRMPLRWARGVATVPAVE